MLPKGFVRVRNYGHASHSSRAEYLARCRTVLGIDESGDAEPLEEPESLSEDILDEDEFAIDIYGGVSLKCPKCSQPMQCVSFTFRPSWKKVMSGPHRPAWYES